MRHLRGGGHITPGCSDGHTLISPHKEDAMHHRLSRTLTIIGLMVLLGGGLSWASPPNPTPSDAQGNTAGGTNALQNNTRTNNTALGDNALPSNTTRHRKNASQAEARYNKT